jgi:2-C-methyl-D-erythritol 4-phosphate cytidylyltransferase
MGTVAVALVVAAGRGERLGSSGPKTLVDVAGRPMLAWSIAALRSVAAIGQIVVALPAGVETPDDCVGVLGGAVRSASVRAALAAVRTDGDPVLVHDGARPLVTAALIEAVLAGLSDGGDCAIAATRITDTVKEADESGTVVRTLDRSRLWSVQTPQVFRREALERALAMPAELVDAATDEAWLIEHAGGRVRIIEASAENLKVTTPRDLMLAEQLLAARVD